MEIVREPTLKPVAIAHLRPTQITLGMREVEDRRRRWRALGKKKQKFLDTHMIPVILGPSGGHYIIDHHHLARALHDEGAKEVLVTVIADLGKLKEASFWFVMDSRDWTHPFDENGKRRDVKDIPKSVDKMIDDPYRSLAGELRRVGGYSKETTPFSEFLWADFLRRRVTKKTVEKRYGRALKEAQKLAKSHDADYLPGWCGPAKDD
jgi:hypothetical protein